MDKLKICHQCFNRSRQNEFNYITIQGRRNSVIIECRYEDEQQMKVQAMYQLQENQQIPMFLRQFSICFQHLQNQKALNMGSIYESMNRIAENQNKNQKLSKYLQQLKNQIKQLDNYSPYQYNCNDIVHNQIDYILKQSQRKKQLLHKVILGLLVIAALATFNNIAALTLQIIYIFDCSSQMASSDQYRYNWLLVSYFLSICVYYLIALMSKGWRRCFQVQDRIHIFINLVIKIISPFFVVVINLIELFKYGTINKHFQLQYNTTTSVKFFDHLILIPKIGIFLGFMFYFQNKNGFNYSRSQNSTIDTIVFMLSVVQIVTLIMLDIINYINHQKILKYGQVRIYEAFLKGIKKNNYPISQWSQLQFCLVYDEQSSIQPSQSLVQPLSFNNSIQEMDPSMLAISNQIIVSNDHSNQQMVREQE